MKYSDSMIKRIMKAVETCPMHTFWGVRIECRFDETETCSIRFTTLGDTVCEFLISSSDVHAIVIVNDDCQKWCGSFHYKDQSYDTMMMWIGYKLNVLYETATEYEDAS